LSENGLVPTNVVQLHRLERMLTEIGYPSVDAELPAIVVSSGHR
jgi:hypothetical protein